MALDLELLLNSRFKFEPRDVPLTPDLRPQWRMGLILLMLEHCYGRQANFQQLHLLNWGIRNARVRDALLAALRGDRSSDEATIRFDPTLDRAVHFAIAYGLVFITKTGDFAATPEGEKLLSAIDDDIDIYIGEKAFLNAVGKLTKSRIATFFV